MHLRSISSGVFRVPIMRVLSGLCAACLFAAPSLVQAQVKKSPILIITYADYKPYSWREAGRVQGLEIDILNLILQQQMGYQLKHEVLPWERAQQHVETGLADAFIATRNTRRDQYAKASNEALTYWDVALYFRHDDLRLTEVNNLQDLKPYRIGSLLGNAWIESNLQGMDVQFVSRMELLPRMLMAGRIDIIPDNPLVIRPLLQQENLTTQVRELPLPMLRKEMVLYVGQRSPLRERMAEFEALLLKMKQDGQLQKLHNKYMGAIPGKPSKP